MAGNTEIEFTEKYGLSKADALRWILGSLAVGGGARAGLGLYRGLTRSAPSVQKSDLSDAAVDIPIDLSEGAAAKYQDLRRRYGLDEEDEQDILKAAEETGATLPKPPGSSLPGWADPAMKALLGVGGSLAGWSVVSNILRRNREQKLKRELDEAQNELDMLSSISPGQIGKMGNPKLSAVAEWLDDMAEIECEEICSSEKTAGIWSGLKDALIRVGKKAPAASTVGKGLAGAGLAGAGVYAGNRLIGATGEKVHRAASNVKKEVTEGSDSAMGKALGILTLIGAIPLMYGAYKGFSETSKVSPRQKRLKMFREELRKSEDAKSPYFRLKPRISKRTNEVVEPKSTGPEELGLTTPYREREEEELKAASDRLFNSLFSGD